VGRTVKLAKRGELLTFLDLVLLERKKKTKSKNKSNPERHGGGVGGKYDGKEREHRAKALTRVMFSKNQTLRAKRKRGHLRGTANLWNCERNN